MGVPQVPLVLIHGWGMHSGMWDIILPALKRQGHVHCVDLPGHGKNISARFTLDSIVNTLAETFTEPINVCGWSLGGEIALHWAQRFPQQIRKLILVASTPCFAERADWSCGMPQATLQQFAADLERDHAGTLRRFLALQVRGSDNERALLSDLRAQLDRRGEPDVQALRDGLTILRDTDLRAELPLIQQPVLLIAGARDRLTPPEASRYMAEKLPDARLIEIAGAAHAPFLSHPKEFLQGVIDFLQPPLPPGERGFCG
ncbi:MAG: pimeloyl-ACP methyl ester esterase BioH [Gallionellaceae bacterium]|jgi:pimeloyl-[acyl-carrier protein] methyl ester esterase|nr:pimeloyl-ACP methyl ester esterase BioH [Gallionellaceae bacterium]